MCFDRVVEFHQFEDALCPQICAEPNDVDGTQTGMVCVTEGMKKPK